MALGSFLATFSIAEGCVEASPTQFVETLQTQVPADVIGLPLAAFVSAVAAYACVTRGRFRLAAVLGSAVGLLTGWLVGLDSVSLATWWLASVPTDSNRAAVELAAPLSLAVSFAVVLAVGSAWPPVRTDSHRRPWVPHLGIGAALGLFAGAGIGGAVGGTQGFLDCAAWYGCSGGPNVFDAVSSGAALGAWAGAAGGCVAGLLAYAMLRVPGRRQRRVES